MVDMEFHGLMCCCFVSFSFMLYKISFGFYSHFHTDKHTRSRIHILFESKLILGNSFFFFFFACFDFVPLSTSIGLAKTKYRKKVPPSYGIPSIGVSITFSIRKKNEAYYMAEALEMG